MLNFPTTRQTLPDAYILEDASYHDSCGSLNDGSVEFPLQGQNINYYVDYPATGHTQASLHSRAPRSNVWPSATADETQTCDNDCWLIYDAVKASGVHNFLDARIPLPHGLHIKQWRKQLMDYTDQELCDFLEFGFPINYVASTPPVSVIGNHSSALDYPQDNRKYLDSECALGAMLGPFSTPPFQPWFHTSPLMTRPKKSADSRRVIVDLSWPVGASVNSSIPRDTYLNVPYKLRLPTVDDLVKLILHHGTGC